MVDDFMVCVDRLIASACYESEISLSSGDSNGGGGGGSGDVSVTDQKKKHKNTSGGGVECRICQEEDEEQEMEAPCACNGTLKFAHRRCIQKWCNKKGDITCEICNQVYAPNYTPPPERSFPDVMPIDIRQAYIDSQFVALTVAEREFLQSEYDDHAFATNGSLACFRSVSILLMLILLIHQALMVSRDFGMVQESSTFFKVSLLQLAGFLLLCFVMARSCYVILCRRRRQG